jgi:hypothetical protein
MEGYMKLVKNKHTTRWVSEPFIKVQSKGLQVLHTEGFNSKSALKRLYSDYMSKSERTAKMKQQYGLSEEQSAKIKKDYKLPGLLCTHCETFIYSAYRHDFKACHCYELTQGESYIAIDGGIDYCKITGEMSHMVNAHLNVNTMEVWAEPYEKQSVKVVERFRELLIENQKDCPPEFDKVLRKNQRKLLA